MFRKRDKSLPEINSGAMADVAFLLLIFFIVISTIEQEKGLLQVLPPYKPSQTPQKIEPNNLLTIELTKTDKPMLNGVVTEWDSITTRVIAHVRNNGLKPNMSTSPEAARVYIKSSADLPYSSYIRAHDQVNAAYVKMWADVLGISPAQYRSLNPKTKEGYDGIMISKKKIPYQVSENNWDKP